jgi:opacity protein-like surface antigen
MRDRPVVVVVFVLLLTCAPAASMAQTTVFGGVSAASLWDDETFLGRGPMVSGGIAQSIGGHARVEGELAWATHHRGAGYLAADGTPFMGTARLAFAFPPPGARLRPFASAGLAIVHSTGHFTTRTILPGPGGFPVEGPSVRRDWSLTKPAFEVGAGVTIASGDRLSLRPEFRWTSTVGDDLSQSGVAAPIWAVRTGLTIEWRLTRGFK